MKRISTATEIPPRPSKNGHAPPAGYSPPRFDPKTLEIVSREEAERKAAEEHAIAIDAEVVARAKKAEEEGTHLAEGITNAPVSRCPLPQRKHKILWVERLKGAQKGRYLIYSTVPWGYQTHYNKETVLCFEDHSQCEGGHRLSTLRDNYLLHCHSYQRKAQVMLYLTPGAALQLKELLPPGQSYRGLMIEITRTKEDKGRYHVEIIHHQTPPKSMPEPMDPRPTLDNWFGIFPGDAKENKRLSPGRAPDEAQEG